MNKSCSIYVRTDGIYVLSLNRKTSSWIAKGFCKILLLPHGNELTVTVKEALSQSRDEAPVTKQPIALPKEIRERNHKSWSAFERGAQLINVEILDEKLMLDIQRPYEGGGFVSICEEIHSSAELDNIGDILMNLLHRDGSTVKPSDSDRNHSPAANCEALPEVLPQLGARLQHLFRGECTVIGFERAQGILPMVVVEFPNGESQTLSLPCPILKPIA